MLRQANNLRIIVEPPLKSHLPDNEISRGFNAETDARLYGSVRLRLHGFQIRASQLFDFTSSMDGCVSAARDGIRRGLHL